MAAPCGDDEVGSGLGVQGPPPASWMHHFQPRGPSSRGAEVVAEASRGGSSRVVPYLSFRTYDSVQTPDIYLPAIVTARCMALQGRIHYIIDEVLWRRCQHCLLSVTSGLDLH